MATPVNIEVQNRQAGISVEGSNSQGIELELFPRASVQVDFSASATSINELDSVTFTAQDDSDIVDWYWEVQDGGNFFFKRGKQVSHTFRNTGKQDVILTATNGVELYGVLRRNDFIEVNVGNFDEFIFDIDTTKSGATANNQFQLPFIDDTTPSRGDYQCEVDKGDGSPLALITEFDQAETLLTYSSGGTYTVKIKGRFNGWNFGNSTNPNDATKLTEIKQWGDLGFIANAATDIGGYLAGCSNMTISATDVPNNLNQITNFSSFFRGCSSITTVPNMNFWDTSNVNDMNRMFRSANSFNADIGGWDVSSVSNMQRMFRFASSFNADIGFWDVSSVIDMNRMFDNASSFNQDISGWDVSSVTDMSLMFFRASSFNQDISAWQVQNVNDFIGFIADSAMSTANYDALLIAWEQQNLQSNVTFGAGTIKYSSGAPANARQSIINNYSWTFNDGGVI